MLPVALPQVRAVGFLAHGVHLQLTQAGAAACGAYLPDPGRPARWRRGTFCQNRGSDPGRLPRGDGSMPLLRFQDRHRLAGGHLIAFFPQQLFQYAALGGFDLVDHLVGFVRVDCQAIDGSLAEGLLEGAKLDPDGFAAVCAQLAGDRSEELLDLLI